MLGAIFDDLSCAVSLSGRGDVKHAGLDETRAEAAPVRLCEAYDERFFGGILGLEGLAEAAEDCFVFLLVFLREDYECGGRESVFQTILTTALFPGFGLRSAFAAVATIGLALSF